MIIKTRMLCNAYCTRYGHAKAIHISFRFPFDSVSICITSPLQFNLSLQRMSHSTQMNALVRRDVDFDGDRPRFFCFSRLFKFFLYSSYAAQHKSLQLVLLSRLKVRHHIKHVARSSDLHRSNYGARGLLNSSRVGGGVAARVRPTRVSV